MQGTARMMMRCRRDRRSGQMEQKLLPAVRGELCPCMRVSRTVRRSTSSRVRLVPCGSRYKRATVISSVRAHETPARVALTVGIGAAGAAAFTAVGAPLAFMLGSLFATAGAALSGLPVLLPPPVRLTWQTLIGVALGANFTVQLFTRAGALTQSLAALLVATALATATSALLLRTFARYELATSFFAAVPGGLNDMTLVGGELGGDERVIALSHTVRLVTVVSLLPLFMRSTVTAPPTTMPAAASALMSHAAAAWSLTWNDALLLLGCAACGPIIGRALRLPARFLVGPLLLSGIAHVTGLTHATPPRAIISVAQIVVGAAVGCRFAGVRLAAMRHVAAWALCTTAVQMAVCASCAAAMSGWSGIAFPVLLLAYSPGGITEMTLTSVALGLDAACVATHHIMRIIAITLGMPLAFALWGRVREWMDGRVESTA